jgi:hypothetical protein
MVDAGAMASPPAACCARSASSGAPARYALVCTPAELERDFDRIAAEKRGRPAGAGAGPSPSAALHHTSRQPQRR